MDFKSWLADKDDDFFASTPGSLEAEGGTPTAPAPAAPDPARTFAARAAERAEAQEQARAKLAAEMLRNIEGEGDDAARMAQRQQFAAQVAGSGGPRLDPSNTAEFDEYLAAKAGDIQRVEAMRQSSALADWVLESRDNAVLARQDMENLTTLAGTFDAFGRSWAVGFDETAAAWRAGSQGSGYDELVKLDADLRRVETLRAEADAAEAAGEDATELRAEITRLESHPAYPAVKSIGDISIERGDISAEDIAPGSYGSSARWTFAQMSPDERQQIIVEQQNEFVRWSLEAARVTAETEAKYGRTASTTRAITAMGEIRSRGLGTWGEIGAALEYAVGNPGDFLSMTGTMFGENIVPLGLSIAASALVPGSGTGAWVARGVAGGAAAAAYDSPVAAAAMARQIAAEEGFDLTTEEGLIRYLTAPEGRAKIRQRAARYGLAIAAIDVASGGLAGKTLSQNPFADVVMQEAAQVVLGGGGEIAAQALAGQTPDGTAAVMVGAMSALSAPVQVLGVTRRRFGAAVEQRHERVFFERLAEGSEQSSIRKALPKKYREVVERLTKDGPVENVYVDAAEFHQLARSLDVDPEALFQNIPGIDHAAIKQALDTEGVIEIPTAAYAAHIVGQDFETALREHIKTKPDGMSAFEAANFHKQLADLASRADKIAEEVAASQSPDDQRLAAEYERMTGQLVQAGRDARVARVEAAQSMAFVRTLADRLGRSVSDVLDAYPLANVRRVFEGVTDAQSIAITPRVVETLRRPAAPDDDAVVRAIRSAAETAGLDPATATPDELTAALVDEHGPLEANVLLSQERLITEADLARPVVEADFSGVTRDFLARPGWAALTASREGGKGADVDRNAALEADLNAAGIPFKRMEGMYMGETDGPSYLIFADEATARALGAKYQQHSILTNNGLVHSDDATPNRPLAPEELVTGPDALKRDFYSVMEDGSIWSVGFADELNQSARTINDAIAEQAALDEARAEGRPQYIPSQRDRMPRGEQVARETPIANRPGLNPRPDGMVELVHWSGRPLDVITPEKWGSGPYGRSSQRAGYASSYYGLNVLDREHPFAYRRENSLGVISHIVAVDPQKLYPFFEDPDGLRADGDTNLAYVEKVKAAGHEGIYVTEDGTGRAPLGDVASLFVAKTPEHVGTLDRTFYQSGAEPIFFSALTREVENAKQKTATGKDWKAIIKKLPGVKDDEIAWSGVEAWLDTQEGQVPREVVAAFLRENELQIETVQSDVDGLRLDHDVTFSESRSIDEHWLEEMVEDRLLNDAELAAGTRPDEEIRDELRQQIADEYDQNPAINHYVDVMDADDRRVGAHLVIEETDGQFYWNGDAYGSMDDALAAIRELDGIDEGGFAPKFGEYVEDGLADEGYREVLLTVPNLHEAGPNEGVGLRPFTHASHFDAPNVVVHSRFTDRKDSAGKRVMFLEEMQSDLSSEWRKRTDSNTGVRAREKATEGETLRGDDIPITPFEGEAYVALVAKRMLRMAVDEGFDKLAWTPAYMQLRRWGGGDQVVTEVQWGDAGNGERNVEVTIGGAILGIVVDAEGNVHGIDGYSSRTGAVDFAQYEGAHLSKLIGPAAAQVLGTESGRDRNVRQTVGTSGFSTVYDSQMRRFMDKFVKKLGGKVTLDTSMPDFSSETQSPRGVLDETVQNRGADATLETLRNSGLRADNWWAALESRERARREDIVGRTRDEFQRAVAEGMRDTTFMEARLRTAESNLGENFAGVLLDAAFRIPDFAADASRVLQPEPPKSEPIWSVEITPKMRETIQQAQPLFQRRNEGKRGSIVLPPGDGQRPLINLFEEADLSTFLHESGHHFLYVLQDLQAKGELTEGMAKDWATITDWWVQNAEGVAKDGGVTADQVRLYLKRGTTGDATADAGVHRGLHEQWARAYEAYLMEGKAPSNALRTAFEAFSAWLRNLYEQVTQLDVKLSDEMRGVFDRLLATDQEIAQRGDEFGFSAMSAETAKALGITDAAYRNIVELANDARDEARQSMLDRVMSPLRAQKRKQKSAETKALREQITAEVNARPHNRAREWLANERWLGDGAPENLPMDLRLDKQDLIDTYGINVLGRLPKGKRAVWTDEGGLPADEIAGWFGYRSGDAMIQDLMTAPTAKADIDARMREALAKDTPDPMTDGTMELHAIRALHGDKRGQLLAAELRAMQKHAPKGVPTTARQARAIARQTLRGMAVRQAVRSDSYLAAERRAGERVQQLVAQGDLAGAFEAKRRQLLHYAFYREAMEVDELVTRTENRVRRLTSKGTRKNLAGEYLAAIDEILDGYDFRKSVTGKAEGRRAALLAYVEMMTAAGRENELAIPDHVLDEARRKPYRTLTAEELEGVLDTLINIEHTARLKKKLVDAKQQRDLDEVVGGLVGAFDKNVPDAPRNRTKTRGERRGDLGREYLNLLLNADTLLRKIDGFDMGAAYHALKTSIDEAGNWARAERQRATDKFTALYAPFSRRERTNMGRKRLIRELGGEFSRWDLISAALNMGNAENLNRLTDPDSGRGFTDAQVELIKQSLTQKEWAFVEGMWRTIAEYWPMIEAREKRLTGVAPKRVEPHDVVTPFGTIEGGYYPIKYDGDLSGRVSAEEIADVQKRMLAGQFGKAQTRNGHLKERAAGSGGRVLKLGIEVAHQHVGQVIHDLAFSEPVANAWKVLQDPRTRSAFERKNLLKDYQSLEMWLQDVATGNVVGGGVMGHFAMLMKHNFTMSRLMFNMSTVLIQLSGVAQSATQIGSRNMAIGAARYLANPARTSREVMARSEFMRDRQTTFQRDISEFLSEVGGSPLASRKAQMQRWIGRYGFWLFQKVQFFAVDMPTWLGAYEDRLRTTGGDEAAAIHYADRMTARSQASGVAADLSAFERGSISRDTRFNGFIRLFTTLGSYMFAKGNIAYEVVGRTRNEARGASTARQVALTLKAAADLTMLFTVEAIFYNMIKGTTPGGDEDDESWLAFLAKETGFSIMGTMPGLRDVASGMQGFDVGAYASVGSMIVGATNQISQGELDIQMAKALSNALGLATGVPSGQLNRLMDAWYRQEVKGEDVAPIEYLMGRR